MKTFPQRVLERGEIDFRLGIKSSLSNLRSVVALMYAIYVANDRKAYVQYTEEYTSGVNTKIRIEQGLLAKLSSHFPTISVDVNTIPLLTSQMEALQVGIATFFKLGKLEFVGGRADSSERTGGNRYNKVIKFAPNIKLLDIYLLAFNQDDVKQVILSWLENQISAYTEIERGLEQILTLFSEETRFKMRTASGDREFQQEGVYKELIGGNTVESGGDYELVGPFRIFKSYVKEGLHPYITDNRTNGFELRPGIVDFSEYADLVSNGLDIIPKRTIIQIEGGGYGRNAQNSDFVPDDCRNKIFYGAPGTGKSHKVRELTHNQDKTVVTFHPDSDYSSFVGAYKPQIKDDKITYGFVPQAFAKAYVAAWQNPEKRHYLIIEEINRGNCAQIFGDIFQLLDRRPDGYSEYVIDVDKDFADYLKSQLNDNGFCKDTIALHANIEDRGENDDKFPFSKITLPGNMFIYATMNTSDQSLFPMDSAFKRRWEWEYLPIDYSKTECIEIEIGESRYAWGDFLQAVNPKIREITNSEDKQLGPFFVTTLNGVISLEQFRSKVLFYLWFEIFKDEAGTSETIFKISEEEFSFGDLFGSDAENKIRGFMSNLKIETKNDE